MNKKEKLEEATIKALQGKLNLTESYEVTIQELEKYIDKPTSYDVEDINKYTTKGNYPNIDHIIKVMQGAKADWLDYTNNGKVAHYSIYHIIDVLRAYSKGYDDKGIQALMNSYGVEHTGDVGELAMKASRLKLTSEQISTMANEDIEDMYQEQILNKRGKTQQINTKNKYTNYFKSIGLSDTDIQYILNELQSEDSYTGKGYSTTITNMVRDNLNEEDGKFLIQLIRKYRRNDGYNTDNMIASYYLEKILASGFGSKNIPNKFITDIYKERVKPKQIEEILLGIKNGLTTEQVLSYMDLDFSPQKMRKIRQGLEQGKTMEQIFAKPKPKQKEYSGLTPKQIYDDLLKDEGEDYLNDLAYAYMQTKDFDYWLEEVSDWSFEEYGGLIPGIMEEYNVSRSTAMAVAKRLYKEVSE